MFCRLPYTEINGKHRPYMEVLFCNPLIDANSSKTFALVDSGADHTLIPYSIGSYIGLPVPTAEEELSSVNGVGGDVSYISRDLQIYLANRSKNKIYVFNETVWWLYPNKEMETELKDLEKEYKECENLQSQSIEGSDLHSHFENQKTIMSNSYSEIMKRLEGEVLLGRPFFNNFEFIQFFHKDREQEDRCFFNYKVITDKVVNTLDIPRPNTP